MISSLDACTHRRTGRTIGVLLLVQLAFAPIANFVLLKPVFAAPGFLENAAAHSLQVSLGAKANPADGELFQGLRVVVASARNWAHYFGLIVAGSMVFVLYAVLCRFTLIPRALAAFGMAAALLVAKGFAGRGQTASPARVSTMLSSGEAP
jgi:hypothetical protein